MSCQKIGSMTSQIPKISITPGEHCMFAGMTGSGKTVLARWLLRGVNRLIVVDPKHEYVAEGTPEYKYAFKLRPWWSEYRLVWRPNRTDDEKLSDLLRKAYKQGGVYIYADELTSLAEFYPTSTTTLKDFIRTGREREVSVLSSFQRPRFVPRYFISESRHRFVFTLEDLPDRKRAAEFMGPEVLDTIEFYNFYYKGPGLTEPVALHYSIPEGQIVPAQSSEFMEV